jgi:phosphoribosylamine--glycine ligase/phosphoribosylformylglycinamidine cyclo-ligase
VGIPVFGPSKEAAQLEGSKAFSKEFMREFNIPTAEFRVFTEYEKAKDYIKTLNYKYVIKVNSN